LHAEFRVLFETLIGIAKILVIYGKSISSHVVYLFIKIYFNLEEICRKYSGRITGSLVFFHRPIFQKIENTTFRKLDLFPKRRVFYLLEYRTMENIQKPSNYVWYTPWSEHFRIYSERIGEPVKTWEKCGALGWWGRASACEKVPKAWPFVLLPRAVWKCRC
jgi:hypothetical protein